MKIKEHMVSVTVIKRVQEEDFEPFEIQLKEGIIADKINNPKKLRAKLYNKMKDEVDILIDERLTEIEEENK